MTIFSLLKSDLYVRDTPPPSSCGENQNLQRHLYAPEKWNIAMPSRIFQVEIKAHVKTGKVKAVQQFVFVFVRLFFLVVEKNKIARAERQILVE